MRAPGEPRLDAEHAAFVQTGVSVVAAARDTGNVPRLARSTSVSSSSIACTWSSCSFADSPADPGRRASIAGCRNWFSACRCARPGRFLNAA